MMGQWGWADKVRYDGTHLSFVGFEEERKGPPNDACYRKYSGDISALCDVLKPQTVVAYSHGVFHPNEETNSYVDKFILQINAEDIKKFIEKKDEHIQWYCNKTRTGRCEIQIGVNRYHDRDDIREFSRHFKVNDGEIWIVPRGETMEEVRDSYSYADKFTKSNSWKLSPRLDTYEWDGDSDSEGDGEESLQSSSELVDSDDEDG